MKSTEIAALCAAIFCVVLLAGCGNPDVKSVTLASVKGKVLFNGGPLAEAVVTFVPDKGPVAVGKTDFEGNFKLMTGGKEGCAVGPVVATVSIAQANKETAGQFSQTNSDEDRVKMQEKMMKQMQSMGRKEDKKEDSLIPDKYRKSDTSPLKFEVSTDASKNDFSIDVSS